MEIDEVMDICALHPYGTEDDEFDRHSQCYHWELDKMIEGSELVKEDGGEDILWKLPDGKLYWWRNSERTYEGPID